MKNEELGDKKKVLVICQHFWPENFRISDIAAGLVESGFEVDVLCGIPNYPGGKFYRGYGFTKNRKQTYRGANLIRVAEVPRGNNSNFRIIVNFISFPFFALFHIPKLMLRKYDRIIIYSLSPVFMALPGILLGKIKNIKTYIYIMDFWPHSLFSIIDIKNKWARTLLTKMSYWHYKKADGLIAVYKGIQTRLIETVGIDKNKTIYIAQAAEKIYEKDVYDNDLKTRFKDGFNIVFAGSINPGQSFKTVLKAAQILKKQGYEYVRFIIIGEGMSKKWLVDEVTRLRLTNQFIFEGLLPVEMIPKYHTVADALIVTLSRSPLFEYATPAKLQSYMASGKPIVAAMDGEGQRIINKSGCGICVDSGDATGLSEAIIKVAEMSPRQRKSMGSKGRKYHFEHYERDNNLNRLIEFVFHDNIIEDTEYDY